MSSSSYAVAVNGDHVFIWDYAAPAAHPPSRRITLPIRCKPTEPLPFASVVISNSSTEVGLVLVYPASGKIFYWENVDSIQSLSLFQQRKHLVEGTVTGLLSRDTIDQLIDAESIGYILLFSSGRLAHVSIRDAQGRPHINVSLLNAGPSTGWLSSWTHALGRGWREAISSVRTRPSATKGQVEIIGLNGEALFKTWEINWAGNSNFIGEHNVSEEIRSALIRFHLLNAAAKEEFKTLDFVVLTEANGSQHAIIAPSAAPEMHILTLVGIQVATSTRFALVELMTSSETAAVSRVIPIAYESPERIANLKPQLLLPKPEHTVFIVLDDAVYIVSLEQTQQSINGPDDQLLAESYGPAIPFQDVIYFRKDKGAIIDTAAVEHTSHNQKHEQASIVLLTKQTGLVRVTATDPAMKGQSPDRHKITAKSKLEQAIFYGSDPGNILDFTHISAIPFSMTEVEEAALTLSREIIDTRTPFLPEVLPSMDVHLNLRAKALRDLITFLKTHYQPLSRRTRWQLVWDAEKVSAARGIWNAYERQIQVKEPGATSFFLEHLMLALHDKYKQPLRPEVGQLDAVRQWFTKDVSRLDRILSNSSHALTEPTQKGVDDISTFVHWTLECEEIWFGAYEAVFSFREDFSNLELYGLESEDLQNGILKSGYEGLEEFWTSRASNVNAVRQCARYFRRSALSAAQKAVEGITAEKAKQIAIYQPRLVRLCCLIHTERFRWLLEQDNEELKLTGQKFKDDYEANVAHEEIVGLASLDQAEAGMKLAEQLHEIPALVDLILDELVFYAESCDDPQVSATDRVTLKKKLSALEDQVQRYFKMMGEEFASAFYDAEIRDRHLGDLLSKNYGKPEQLTAFLRADPLRAKLSWINDIINEKDWTQAAQALNTVAAKQEHNTWSKKIELSLAKLALLSEQSSDAAAAMTTRRKSMTIDKFNREMLAQNRRDTAVLDIQDQLFRHVRPIIMTALDDAGASEAIMATYGEHLRDRPQLQELLRRGLEQLLKHQTMAPSTLIDVLTLIDHVHSESTDDDISGNEFLMALAVLEASDLRDSIGKSDGEGDIMARLIWKRLLVFDDWKNINNTVGKSDSQVQQVLMKTALFVMLKEGIAQCKLYFPMHFNPRVANFSAAIFGSTPAYSIRYPTDVIGAGSTVSDFESRFAEADLRKGFVKDNSKDDKTLQEYIKAARMDYWFDAVKQLALKKAEEESDLLASEAERFRQFQSDYQAPELPPEEAENDEEIPLEEEEEEDGQELVLNGVEEYVEDGDTEEDEHLMSGGRDYIDEDVEMEG